MKLFLILIALFVSVVALGQDGSEIVEAIDAVPDWVPVDPIFVPPEWLEQLLLMIKGLPTVGPILVTIGQWAGVLAVITTSLAVCAISILKSMRHVVKHSEDLQVYTNKIEKVLVPVIYWLKYVSLLNAQPKKVRTAGDIVAEKEKKA
jgi:hypothetical protein